MPARDRAGLSLVLLVVCAWVAWAAAGNAGFSVPEGWRGVEEAPGAGGVAVAAPDGGAPEGGGVPSGPPAGAAEPPAWVTVPPRGWAVAVAVDRQRVFVYRDGVLERVMVCSTGTPDKPTPAGEFRVQTRGEWFFSEKYKQGGRFWVSFHNWGEYLFHSVPMDREGRVLEEEAARLGQPASHGCVRLSLEDAEWFYRNVPDGTPVTIR